MRPLRSSLLQFAKRLQPLLRDERGDSDGFTHHFAILPVIFVLAMLPHSRFHAASAASSGILLVANKGDRTLGIIDPEAGKQVATVAENGNTGHEVIRLDSHRAYGLSTAIPVVGKPGGDGTNLVAIDIALALKIIKRLLISATVVPIVRCSAPRTDCSTSPLRSTNQSRDVDPGIADRVGLDSNRSSGIRHMLKTSPRDGRYGYTNVGSGDFRSPRYQAERRWMPSRCRLSGASIAHQSGDRRFC